MCRTLVVLSLLVLSLASASAITVTGTVVGTDGTPVSGANIWVRLWFADKTLELHTDVKGEFAVEIDSALLPQSISLGEIIASAPGCTLTIGRLRRGGNVITLSPGTTMSGMVVDAMGKPLAGVPVRLVSLANTNGRRGSVPDEWHGRFTVRTATDGVWTLSGIPLDGEAVVALDDDRFVHDEQQISLVAGEKIDPVRFTVRPGATVTGRIFTPEGLPAAHVRVGIDSRHDPEQAAASDSSWGRTGADGSYRFSGLTAGSYDIGALSEENAWVAEPLQGVTLTAGKTTIAPVLHARFGAALDGTVVDAETGTPIPGIHLKLFHGSTIDYASGAELLRTDAQGHFVMHTQPGQMTLFSDAPQCGYRKMPDAEAMLVELREGKTVTVVVRLHKGLSLRGIVTDAGGKPAAWVNFSLRMPDWAYGFTTDEQGQFEVSGLQAGKGTLMLQPESLDVWELSSPQTVEVPAPGAMTVKVSRLALHILRGRVVDARHHPQAGVDVAFSVPIQPGWGPQTLKVVTGEDGNYQLAKIPAGRKVTLISLTKAGYRQLVNSELASAGNDTLADAMLGDALLQGTVLDAETGLPLPDASVKLYHDTTLQDSLRADRHGHFFYRARGAAQLSLLIDEPPSGYRKMLDTEAVHVELREGETATAELKLHKGLSMTGTVKDEEGQPVAGASFCIHMPSGVNKSWYWNDTSITVTTDDQGNFSVSGLPAGKGTIMLLPGRSRQPDNWAMPEPLDIEAPSNKPIAVTVTRIAQRSVTGRVVDTLHHPLPGVRATLLVSGEQYTGLTQQTAITGTDGTYQLAKIPAGREVILLSLEKPGYCQLFTSRRTNAGTNAIDDAVMAAATTLHGTVCDKAGKPVKGATVVSMEAGRSIRAVTDAAGAFTLTEQPKSELHLVAATPDGGGVAQVNPGTDIRIICTPGLVAGAPDVPRALALLEADGKLPRNHRRFNHEDAIRKLADIDLAQALQLAMAGNEPVSDDVRAYLLGRQAEKDPAKVDELLVQLNILRNAGCKLYDEVKLGIAVARREPALAAQLYNNAKASYDSAMRDFHVDDEAALSGFKYNAGLLVFAETLGKTADLDAMLAQLRTLTKQVNPGWIYMIADPLFETVGQGSPEFVLKVYDSLDNPSLQNYLGTAVARMAQRDPAAALRLLKLIDAKKYDVSAPDYALPLIDALGKQDPAAALALAEAQPDYLRTDALLAAASFQPKAEAVTRIHGLFPAGCNPMITQIARANAIDAGLGKKLYTEHKQNLEALDDMYRIDNSLALHYNRCAAYAYHLSDIDPVEARLLLETEYARALSLSRHGVTLDLRSFALAMCALDLHRALAMLDDSDNLDPDRIMQYLLMSREERLALSNF